MGTPVTAAGSASQPNTLNSTTSKKSGKDLDVNDFFNLLAAQLKNQTMLNPVDDTQLIAQMAQFSALSSTQQLNSTFTNFLSVSYIGKNIKAQITDYGGKTQTIEGPAQKVEFKNGQTYITVNGTKITPDQITEVTENKTTTATTVKP